MSLDKIKTSLRIKNNSEEMNTEITDLIEACKADLLLSGVKRIPDTDPLIQQAIKLYCKANFGLDNKDSDRYKLSYESLKQSLALCGDYNVE
ncbi:head-tail connector protein [Clostridium cellulovorans]|uniref:Putative phage protein n=1 Tax=Clostridium cellulovorans (strain ATCC 35296 / DSM 3052 / OCM 3 / 743B) TaxID=573061 RepID=D9SQ12_CLOC7|nr:head-tail connector protein [Clostridium cellulovorans]ADL52148.1 putative phage protein [Clostridium cellulovorans 743B]